MASQRTAGKAFCAREKAQFKRSALRPLLPAKRGAARADVADEQGRSGDFEQQSHGCCSAFSSVHADD